MKPPFSYYGGKARLAPWIVSLLPPHTSYIEPFAGSLAVFFAKPPVTHEVVNDVDGEVVAFFRCLRDRPDDLIDAVELTPYARQEFADAKEGSIDDLERARRFWVRVNQSFNKSARLDNGWSASVACQNGEAKTVLNRVARLREAAQRLMGVIIENRDAVDVIQAYGTPTGVIYADPPYVGSTRSQSRAYEHELSTDDDHRALAAVLHESPATVVLSGYDSDLYDDLYADWHRLDQSVLRRSSNRASGERPRATEVIWSNRPLDEGRLAI